jgi:MFS family permease
MGQRGLDYGEAPRQLINRNYARLWSGQAVSAVGDYVFDTTLVLWVGTVLARGRTWAPIAVSGILLAAGLAILLVGPLAGVFVDRWNRKATMMRTEVLRAGLVAALTLVALVPTRDIPLPVWLGLIYVMVFVLNSAGQFFSPARFATIGEVVSGDVDRARAAGIGQATVAVAAILGPPLAAPLLFVFGVKWALAIDALSYVFSYFAIRSVRLASDAPPNLPEAPMADVEQQISSLRADFVAGLRFFMGSRLLIALLAMAVTAALGTGALTTLGVFFVRDNLHTPAHFFGFLSTAFGVGAIAGSLCSARAVRWLGARTLTWLGLLTAGVLVMLYARQTTLLGGLILYGLVSIPVAMLNTAMTPLLLKSAPPEFLGRVVAVFNPVTQLASMLSVVVAGWLASSALLGFHAQIAGVHFGPIDLIYTGAGLLIAAAALCGSVALPHDQAAETVQAAGMDASG